MRQLLLNQLKREIIFPRKNVPDTRIDRGTTACGADTLPTELPQLVERRQQKALLTVNDTGSKNVRKKVFDYKLSLIMRYLQQKLCF